MLFRHIQTVANAFKYRCELEFGVYKKIRVCILPKVYSSFIVSTIESGVLINVFGQIHCGKYVLI